MFKCSYCGKDWPENYCPECARTIDQPAVFADVIVDSDIVRESFSTCAAKVRVNPVRYLWCRDEIRPFFQAWLILAAVTTVTGVLRWWIVAGILLMLTVTVAVFFWLIWRQVNLIFYNAALTAGIVVQQHPLEFISVANMGTGMDNNECAVKRVAVRYLPCYPTEAGTQFPCVSGFQDGPTPELWGDFDPQPLSFGTGNRKLLRARENKLGSEAFAELRRIYEQRNFPRKAGELIWLDEACRQVIPPPLPSSPHSSAS
jgi:hypothetical protein